MFERALLPAAKEMPNQSPKLNDEKKNTKKF
jgi:hypothetical protein